MSLPTVPVCPLCMKPDWLTTLTGLDSLNKRKSIFWCSGCEKPVSDPFDAAPTTPEVENLERYLAKQRQGSPNILDVVKEVKK